LKKPEPVGAGDGTRTRDSLLGGQELYQLSYSRMIVLILSRISPVVKGYLDAIYIEMVDL
jgi:hypothetical protein